MGAQLSACLGARGEGGGAGAAWARGAAGEAKQRGNSGPAAWLVSCGCPSAVRTTKQGVCCKRVRSLITHASTRYRATTAQSHAKWMRYRRRHKDTYPVPVQTLAAHYSPIHLAYPVRARSPGSKCVRCHLSRAGCDAQLLREEAQPLLVLALGEVNDGLHLPRLRALRRRGRSAQRKSGL